MDVPPIMSKRILLVDGLSKMIIATAIAPAEGTYEIKLRPSAVAPTIDLKKEASEPRRWNPPVGRKRTR